MWTRIKYLWGLIREAKEWWDSMLLVLSILLAVLSGAQSFGVKWADVQHWGLHFPVWSPTVGSIVCFAFFLVEIQYRRCQFLEDKISRRLTLTCNNSVDGCVTVAHLDTKFARKNFAVEIKRERAVYFKLKIESGLLGHVAGCEAILTSIRDVGRKIDFFKGRNLSLVFSPWQKQNPTVTDLQDARPAYLNVLVVTENKRVWFATERAFNERLECEAFMYPSDIDPGIIFARQGDFALKILVSAPGYKSEEIELLFRWRNGWMDAELSDARNAT